MKKINADEFREMVRELAKGGSEEDIHNVLQFMLANKEELKKIFKRCV